MKTRMIGDVHGKFGPYKKVIKPVERSIQVGDMGVGFFNSRGEATANPPHQNMSAGNHRFIRGNHDNPGVCTRQKFWIRDGHTEDGWMFVGGGLSIDRAMRTEGFDWWRDEELNYGQFQTVMDTYVNYKPRVMVTHDCPESVALEMFDGHYKFQDPSITRQALDGMFDEHQPDFWFFGHWHSRRNWTIRGTRFVCLAELDWCDFDDETGEMNFKPV